ncbi:MAG: hypothetical protein KAX39_07530 [candidate division Zixibacteria bacterium]|nr:hypothetical protein [candidate division Zixibacteria bacterium]
MKALRIFMMVMLLALPLFASQAMAQPTITCPPGIYTYHENGGPYSTNPNKWTADAGAGQTVTNVIVFSTPPGITATVDFTILPGGQTAEGYVDITVTNYCQTPGGNIVLEAQTTAGNDQCPFLVTLTNTDPVITCPVDASFDWNVGYTGTATADRSGGRCSHHRIHFGIWACGSDCCRQRRYHLDHCLHRCECGAI